MYWYLADFNEKIHEWRSCRSHSSVINPHKDAAGRDTTLKDKKLSVVVEINLERMHIHGKRVETFAEQTKSGCFTLQV